MGNTESKDIEDDQSCIDIDTIKNPKFSPRKLSHGSFQFNFAVDMSLSMFG